MVPARSLPPLDEQVARLVELGALALAGLAAEDLLRDLPAHDDRSALLVVRPDLLPASRLAPLLERAGRPGFVVTDMQDVDRFCAVDPVQVPSSPVSLVHGLDRGDAMLSWSPDEALPAILAAGRSPLTLVEGITWVLQQPAALEPGRCFMTIGSRLRRPSGGLDARTPAVWISGGTGRDGPARRGAPKVGWCWAGNRHTWLGFASAAGRTAVVPALRRHARTLPFVAGEWVGARQVHATEGETP